MTISTVLLAGAGFVLGTQVWFLFEYLLHRFAMHHLHGKGIMSREHLLHHVAAGWTFSTTHLLSWAGMLLVGWLAWFPLGWVTVSMAFGISLAIGWSFGYFFYEYVHAQAHLSAPRNRYQRRLRTHHFHHHFGHPMSNHGVTIRFWDRVFGTLQEPDQVRVPRRMAQPWMLDDVGELLPEYQADDVLVGTRRSSPESNEEDRVAAFASVAPSD